MMRDHKTALAIGGAVSILAAPTLWVIGYTIYFWGWKELKRRGV